MARLVAWFKLSLKKRPVITNTAVYAAFYTAAELSQQSYNKISNSESWGIDVPAAARIVAVGSTLYAPTLYYWYKFLDKQFTGTSMGTVLTKVCLDQFTMTPVLIGTFFTLLGILEGREDVFEELKQKYWKAFFANQIFWIPIQTINFYFVPSNFRVVYVASVSFIWINVMVFIKRQKVDKIEPIDVDEFAQESEVNNNSANQRNESLDEINKLAKEKTITESDNDETARKISESARETITNTEIHKRDLSHKIDLANISGSTQEKSASTSEQSETSETSKSTSKMSASTSEKGELVNEERKSAS